MKPSGPWVPSHLLHHTLASIPGRRLQALQALACLPESESKQSLKMMISYVLERLY
jgi:hypothetical protein